MEANMSIPPMLMRAPYLSQIGPRRKRRKMVPETAMIFEVQTCCLLKSSVFATSVMRGASANQMKKAQKKENQEQWKARICGRLALKSLICVDLSFCAGSTLT